MRYILGIWDYEEAHQRCNLNIISHCNWQCWTLQATAPHWFSSQLWKPQPAAATTTTTTTTDTTDPELLQQREVRLQRVKSLYSGLVLQNANSLCRNTRNSDYIVGPKKECHSHFASKTTPLRTQNTTGLRDWLKNQSNSRITFPTCEF